MISDLTSTPNLGNLLTVCSNAGRLEAMLSKADHTLDLRVNRQCTSTLLDAFKMCEE